MLAMRRENDQLFGNATSNLNGGIESTANEALTDCNGYQTGGFTLYY